MARTHNPEDINQSFLIKDRGIEKIKDEEKEKEEAEKAAQKEKLEREKEKKNEKNEDQFATQHSAASSNKLKNFFKAQSRPIQT